MEAIVLAGGFGTRLAHIVSDVPKPMAPVCDRPFLRFILDNLQRKGVERVILAVGYKQDMIRSYFGGSYRGMKIEYSSEDKPLFTGGAIKQALAVCREERVLVVNGDTFFDVDIDAIQERHSPIVMAVKRLKDFSRYGTVSVKDGLVIGFAEKKPCREGLINGGVYLVDRTLLDAVAEKEFSFEQEVLEPLRYEIAAVESEGYFIDIGVPEDYALSQETMKPYAPVNKAASASPSSDQSYGARQESRWNSEPNWTSAYPTDGQGWNAGRSTPTMKPRN